LQFKAGSKLKFNKLMPKLPVLDFDKGLEFYPKHLSVVFFD